MNRFDKWISSTKITCLDILLIVALVGVIIICCIYGFNHL